MSEREFKVLYESNEPAEVHVTDLRPATWYHFRLRVGYYGKFNFCNQNDNNTFVLNHTFCYVYVMIPQSKVKVAFICIWKYFRLNGINIYMMSTDGAALSETMSISTLADVPEAPPRPRAVIEEVRATYYYYCHYCYYHHYFYY